MKSFSPQRKKFRTRFPINPKSFLTSFLETINRVKMVAGYGSIVDLLNFD
jgi:hypothetical protein